MSVKYNNNVLGDYSGTFVTGEKESETKYQKKDD